MSNYYFLILNGNLMGGGGGRVEPSGVEKLPLCTPLNEAIAGKTYNSFSIQLQLAKG